MSTPLVIAVTEDSPADHAGVLTGDLIFHINNETPRDIIQYQLLVDEPEIVMDIERKGERQVLSITKPTGAPLGIEVDSPLFDQVRTCDNHCEFCFIYQLPRGMRRSLSVKDDDYRLSFLYGNFTTLTRFTEADLERVITEGLSPLYVSIHATNQDKRVEMLRNRRGGTSLRWLRLLLDHGIEVHGQIVVCPGINDDLWLEDTIAGIADQFSEIKSLAVVPLGVSAHTSEPRMRPHTVKEAEMVIDIVEEWQNLFLEIAGNRVVYAADEYYLLASRPFPEAETYGDFPMHEDGIGMARAFEYDFLHSNHQVSHHRPGFFSSVDGAPAQGYRAPRTGEVSVQLTKKKNYPITVLTGTFGASVIKPLLEKIERKDIEVLPVENNFFGGNIGVTGLLVGEDLKRVLEEQPEGRRYLLPDVCLSGGRFLDDLTPSDLPRSVEIIPTDGRSLRQAIESGTSL